MDLSQLSKETMELSEQIGSKQMQLLFDENYFCEDISLEKIQKKEDICPNKPGVAFFIDKSSGSFCLRGAAFSTSSVLEDRAVLEAENHRFHRADKIHWFSCESFFKAQVIVDQMMNRRFPYDDEAICNISDPGASWWLKKTDKEISIYFKSLGRKEEFQKIGPLGDSEIAKYRWKKASSFFSSIDPNISLSYEENSISIKREDAFESESILQSFKQLFIDGKATFDENSFGKTLEQKTLYLYLSELAAIRKFWIMVEGILLTDQK